MRFSLNGIISNILLCSIYFPLLIESRCPNSCSGHGTCGTSNTCTCYDGWNGGAADCSQRTCPTGTAWADKAYAADFAHQPAECSNAGICDRSTGLCKCFAGFTGSACQRSACPNDCSGHGICSLISDVSIFKGPDYDSTIIGAGDGRGTEYTNWDKDSIQLCECDNGYFGADCSIVMCPKGDDPLTINQNPRAIRLNVRSFGSFDLEGILGLQFMGASVPLSVTDPTSEACTTALAFKGKFGHVTCEYRRFSRLHVQFDLYFYSWPTFPLTNNLYDHEGNPSRFDFFCDLTTVTRFTNCIFTDIHAVNVQEYSYCSNRGKCDYVTGTCTCHEGFGGPACSNSTSLYSTGANALPGLEVNVNGLDYVSTALQINSQKSKASDFYFIEALANSETVFYVRGDGTVGINKLRTLSGGQTISGGGLYVESGGCTIADSGLNVFSSDSVDPVLSITSRFSGPLGSTYSAFKFDTESSTPAQLLAIDYSNQGFRKFSVRGDGHVLVRTAGMSVTGGISIGTLGLAVTGGATVYSGGLSVAEAGAVVTGGVTIYTNGLRVITGGAQVYAGGASILSGGMKVAGGLSITGGGFQVTGGITVGTAGIVLTGGMTINTRGLQVITGRTNLYQGLTVTRGVTIYTGGLEVDTGGLSVYAGGLTATGGATIYGGGLLVADGLTVSASGIDITGSSRLRSGLDVTSGITVRNTGIRVASGGVTVSANGISVTGGVNVVNTGLTVQAGGILAAGGASITGGLRVTSGLTVYNSGATILGGLNVGSGITVTGATLIESERIIWSDRRLKTDLAPIDDALHKVSKLQGVYFKWVQNEPSGMEFDTDRHVGVIAQDVQAVLPEVVENTKGIGKKYLGVDYASIVPLLIEAIHDLENHIKSLSQTKQNFDSEQEDKTSPLSKNRVNIVTETDEVDVDVATAVTTATTVATVTEENDKLWAAIKELRAEMDAVRKENSELKAHWEEIQKRNA